MSKVAAVLLNRYVKPFARLSVVPAAHMCPRAFPSSFQDAQCDGARTDDRPGQDQRRTGTENMQIDQDMSAPDAAGEGTRASMGGHAQPAKRPLRTASPLYAAQVSRQSEILAVLLQYYGSGAREQKFPVLSAPSDGHARS